MAYTPTTWVESVTPVGPTNLNHLETGVQAAAAVADSATTAAAAAATTANAAIPKPASIASGEAAAWNGSTFVRSSATNIGPTSLGSGTPDATKYLRGDGAWTVLPTVGQEMAYAEITSTATATATTEGTATTVLTAPSFTADGVSAYLIEVSAERFYNTAGAGASAVLSLFDNGTSIGQVAEMSAASSTAVVPMPLRASRRVVLSAGAHVYTGRLWCSSGTATLGAGTGGAGTSVPAYIRITKAN